MRRIRLPDMLTTMSNRVHPLLTAPASAIDTAMVRGFLELEVEESFTVDYKRGFEDAAETVAAMANTYGGVVLVGVDAQPQDKNLPGPLVGAKAMDKDKLVTKMATTLDPPGWTPDVIPVTVDDKLLLVVCVDPNTAPRPLFYKGAVKVRLDGRNTTADRRLVQTMFAESGEPELAYGTGPRYAPDNHLAPCHRPTYKNAPPNVVVRAAASRPLRTNGSRLRLRGTVVDALTQALSRPGAVGATPCELSDRLARFAGTVTRHEFPGPWEVDPEFGHGRFVRLTAGHGSRTKPPRTGVRWECTVDLVGDGSSLEVIFDALFWLDGDRLCSDLWVQACHTTVQTLAEEALPALTEALLGTAALPAPLVELHIAPGTAERLPLETLLNTDVLGPRVGNGALHRASEYLPEALVASGDLDSAVTEALHNIAVDWRFLYPQLPGIRGDFTDASRQVHTRA